MFLRDTDFDRACRPAHVGDVDEAFRVGHTEFGGVVDGIDDECFYVASVRGSERGASLELRFVLDL